MVRKKVNYRQELNHANYLANVELFCRDICNLQVLSTEDLVFIKTKAKDIARFSYNNNVPKRLPIVETDALKNLKKSKKRSQNKQIFIQKSDNNNSIVIVDRDKYIEKMKFLNDHRKFQKIGLTDDNLFNFITGQKKTH